MSWWKKVIFSIISLVWGFISLDYLYLSFQYLTSRRRVIGLGHIQKYKNGLLILSDPKTQILMLVVGMLMIFLWLLLVMLYTKWLRKLSPQLDIYEKDPKTGKMKLHRKWSLTIAQYLLMVFGAILRWMYLFLWYFPHH